MNKNEAAVLRADFINGQFELNDETKEFMNWVRTECGKLAHEALARAPTTTNPGRFIAALDSLQATKNLFCDAVIQGNEEDAREKRKQEPAPVESAQPTAKMLAPYSNRQN